MANGFYSPRVDLTGRIQNNPITINASSPINDLSDVSKPNFKTVMTDLAQDLNKELNSPENLLKSAMSGNSDVDIHEVMTAMAKAEITVNVATQITTKVIQAYDKIMQISV